MDIKQTVLEIIKKNPGIRFNEIMRISNIRNGTLSHYVKKLEKEEHIDLERKPRVTRMYPKGMPKQDAKICKCLTIETQRKLLLFLLQKGLATSIQIREFLEKSPSVVSVNLNELFKEKIINKQYDIPSNKYSIRDSEQIKRILNKYYPELIKEFEIKPVKIKVL